MISYKNSFRHKLTTILNRTADLFETALPAGLTPKHYGMLLAIMEHPAITQSDLAEKLAIDRSTTGKMIDLLEDCKYVQRGNHPTDRRVYCLKLTAEGETIAVKLWAVMQESERTALVNLTDKEVNDFTRLLNKIINENQEEG